MIDVAERHPGDCHRRCHILVRPPELQSLRPDRSPGRIRLQSIERKAVNPELHDVEFIFGAEHVAPEIVLRRLATGLWPELDLGCEHTLLDLLGKPSGEHLVWFAEDCHVEVRVGLHADIHDRLGYGRVSKVLPGNHVVVLLPKSNLEPRLRHIADGPSPAERFGCRFQERVVRDDGTNSRLSSFGRKVLRLRELDLTDSAIARRLDVTDETVAKGIRWLREPTLQQERDEWSQPISTAPLHKMNLRHCSIMPTSSFYSCFSLGHGRSLPICS